MSDGLSQSYAYSITQDADGFIWIATEDGLNKYDGENFSQYRHDISRDARTLSLITLLGKYLLISNNILMGRHSKWLKPI